MGQHRGHLKGLSVAAVVAASVVAWSGNAFAQAKIVDGPEVRWKLAAWGKPRAATQNVETLHKFMDERSTASPGTTTRIIYTSAAASRGIR